MRSLVLGTVIAASLLSGGCYVATRERPMARYHHHGYVRAEPPPPRVYYERRHYHGDDRGYRHYHDPYWR